MKKHLQRIYRKLCVSTWAGAVRAVEEVTQAVEQLLQDTPVHRVQHNGSKERGFA